MSEIKREYLPVNSAIIKKITYSHFEKDGKNITPRLTIDFVGGATKEYFAHANEVNLEEVYQKMIMAPSVGKFWHKHINNQIDFKKIR